MPWPKGRPNPISLATRRKMSAAKKGRPRSTPISWATRQKMSAAKKGRPAPWANRKGIPPHNKGVVGGYRHTPETRLKIGLVQKGISKQPFTLEHRTNIANVHRVKAGLPALTSVEYAALTTNPKTRCWTPYVRKSNSITSRLLEAINSIAGDNAELVYKRLEEIGLKIQPIKRAGQ